uniref:hypothetical protein n=1 Tax=Niallia taxi TaxID=2499688 RepID=UPI003F4906FA
MTISIAKSLASAQGPTKIRALSHELFSIQGDLRDIQLFHTDHGSKFKNHLIN